MENKNTELNNDISDNQKILRIFGVVISIILIGFIIVFFINKDSSNDSDLVLVENTTNSFGSLFLEATSAYVWDMKEGKVLFSKNEEVQLPLASVTKLMTALISSGLVPGGTIITIDEEDIKEEGESGFFEGERWTLANVTDFTLMTSSNDGAHALASVIGFIEPEQEKSDKQLFLDEMNKRAELLGMTQTFFLSESGLDLNEKMSGAYGSAKDVAVLMASIINTNPNLLEATKYSALEIKSKEKIYNATNTNKIAETIPGIIGSKTGFTDLAGGNLVIAFDIGIGHPIIVSVLGSSRDGRFEDVLKLVNASIEQIAAND